MSYPRPRDGDSTAKWRKRGFIVATDGTIRTPWGHRINGWHGPMTTRSGTIRDRPNSSSRGT